MNWAFVLGGLLSVAGTAGYVAGVFVAYPGRAFSITAFITGVTVVAMFRQSGEGDA